jgi:hypothetical protein
MHIFGIIGVMAGCQHAISFPKGPLARVTSFLMHGMQCLQRNFAKRLIGRKFDDVEVQSGIKHFSFKVFSKGGKPYNGPTSKLILEYRGEEKELVCLYHLVFFTTSH